MVMTQRKDVQGSVSTAYQATSTLFTYTVPIGMIAVLRKLANYTDTAAGVNGATFWSLRKDGVPQAPYDAFFDIVGNQALPPDCETLVFPGGSIITGIGYNGYATATIKLGMRIQFDLIGK